MSEHKPNEANWRPTAWKRFPEKIYFHKGLATVKYPDGEPGLLGPADTDGDLQAEYVLNNVKRLRMLPPILEDVE